MVREGILVQWYDDKGYGFVATPDGGRYFLHVSAIKCLRGVRPQRSDRVFFEAASDALGRPQALHATLGQPAAALSRCGRPAPANDLIDLCSLLLLPVLLVVVWHSGVAGFLLSVIGVLSCCAFQAYWLDKRSAQHGGWRIAERSLHAWALAGGWPGAWLAQRVLRHKSRKGLFRWLYLLTVLLNLAILALLPRYVFAILMGI